MRSRFVLQLLAAALTLVFSSANTDAQVPKNIVFVSSVGSGPPPVTSSSIFKSPFGVAIGASASPGVISGTIYVADPFNNQVVAFPPGGSSTTFGSLPCPNTVPGCVQNPWTLNNPTAVAAAPNGSIWISDTGNDVVVEINSSGTVVAFAGVGPSNVVSGCSPPISNCPTHPNSGQGSGQFFGPGPLAADSVGNVYVADAAGDVFLGAQPSGGFGLGCVNGGAANCPQAANFRIEKFTSTGTYVTSWGSFCSLNNGTTGVIVDNNGDVITGTAGSTCNTSAPGASASGDGQLAYVTGIAVDGSSNVYVSDADNNRVQKFFSDGTFSLKWGGLPTGNGSGQFNATGGIAVDLDQTVYVVDVFNDRIEEFDTSGNFITKGGSNGVGEAQFNHPVDIATVPPVAALACLLGGVADSDCTHGFVVSEQGTNKRVQFLGGRPDTANDGITDDVSITPGVVSNNFSNADLGFETFGTVNAGDQTFVIYNTLDPSLINLINVTTESFGGPTPLTIPLCGTTVTMSVPAGMDATFHCSTPTVTAELGPIGVQFVSNGITATARLNTGASLSVNVATSQIIANAGTINIIVSGNSVSLSPGQSIVLQPPTAVISGPTGPVECASLSGAQVKLNGSNSQAPNGYALTYSWTEDGVLVGGNSPTLTVTVPLGTHTFALTVTDIIGLMNTATAQVTVRDTTPPTLNVSLSPHVLGPPNGKMTQINATTSVSDVCNSNPKVILLSIVSSEPGPGEIQATFGTDDVVFFLQAARLGSGTGRVYTVTYQATDASGNSTQTSAYVTVPHDPGNN